MSLIVKTLFPIAGVSILTHFSSFGSNDHTFRLESILDIIDSSMSYFHRQLGTGWSDS